MALQNPYQEQYLIDTKYVINDPALEPNRLEKISQALRKKCKTQSKTTGEWWEFELDEDPDLDGEVWKYCNDNLSSTHHFGNAMISNKGRVKSNKGKKSYGSLPKRKEKKETLKKGKKSEQEKAYYRVEILGKHWYVHRLQGMVFDQQGLLDAIRDSLIEKGYVFVGDTNQEIYEKMEEDNRNFVPKKKSKKRKRKD